MSVWENKYNTALDAHHSRIIASWVRVGGSLKSRDGGIDGFRRWLEELGIDEDECDEIVEKATCGKLELECSAKNFLFRDFLAKREKAKKALL